MLAVALALVATLASAQAVDPTPPREGETNESSAAAPTHVVGAGDTLYGVVAIYYPDKMARWTDVAADIVALNPDAFPRGLDTVMRLGDELSLVVYPDAPAPVSVAPPASAPATASEPASNPTGRDGATATATNPAPQNAASNPVSAATPSRDATAPTSDTQSTEPAPQNAPNAVAGTVRQVTQRVVAADSHETSRPLAVDEPVFEGDAIATDADATAVFALTDGALLTLIPNSRLHIEQAPDAGGSDRHFILTLIKGGFRYVGADPGDPVTRRLSVNTAVATLALEDASFSARVCARQSCRVIRDGRPLDPGLYVGVLNGVIALNNNSGKTSVSRGEFYHVAAPNASPEVAMQSASLLYDAEELVQLDLDVEEERPMNFFEWLRRQVFGD
ncbi:MAG: FecR domain-containing protein [Pseudomonadota bacterium]